MLPSSAFPKRLDSGRDLEDTSPKHRGPLAFCRVSSGNPSSERGLVVAPQSKRVSPGRMFNMSGRDPLLETSSNRSPDPDEATILASLKEILAAGDQRLDSILGAIAEAADAGPARLELPLPCGKTGRWSAGPGAGGP